MNAIELIHNWIFQNFISIAFTTVPPIHTYNSIAMKKKNKNLHENNSVFISFQNRCGNGRMKTHMQHNTNFLAQ